MQSFKRSVSLLLALMILISTLGLGSTYANNEYQLNTSVPTYVNADNAKYGRNSVSTYSAGTYYIYREYDGMLNISTRSSSPGAWINPKDNTANESVNQRLDEGDTYYVTGSVNVRTGPGTSYATVGKLAKYDQVSGEKAGNWLKFNYNGQTAYSSLTYISDQKPAGQQTTSNSAADTYYVTGSVNVRTGPGTSYAVIGKLARQDQVSGEKTGNWLRFNYNHQTAYASLKYISDQKPASQTTTSKPVIANTSSTSRGQQVANLAKSQVGKRYVFGATGPNSFDCSGLTQFVYRNALGISLSRITTGQWNHGRLVSFSNMEAGDILYFGNSASSIFHVGIYVGNGQYVHASNPTRGVVQDRTNTNWVINNLYGVRRIVD